MIKYYIDPNQLELQTCINNPTNITIRLKIEGIAHRVKTNKINYWDKICLNAPILDGRGLFAVVGRSLNEVDPL